MEVYKAYPDILKNPPSLASSGDARLSNRANPTDIDVNHHWPFKGSTWRSLRKVHGAPIKGIMHFYDPPKSA